jgi:hypothetical protein
MVAPSARIAAAVRRTSSPVRRPVIVVSPTANAPNMSARWEMDLSPGTVMVPVSGLARAETALRGTVPVFGVLCMVAG